MGIFKLLPVMFLNWSLIFFFSQIVSVESNQYKGRILPGIQSSHMSLVDNRGILLVSNNSNFAFGFQSIQNATLFTLAVIHWSSATPVWAANVNNPVSDSDRFIFNETGNAYLMKGESVLWSTNTSGKGVAAIELRDSGNLVLVGNDNSTIWESFSHPTDTLLSSQNFVEGMKLVSSSKSSNLSYVLEIKAGDMMLSAGYYTPQTYWSMRKDSRTIFNKDSGEVSVATISANSWKFYDQNGSFIWQFVISGSSNVDTIWAATLGDEGSISFLSLPIGGSGGSSPQKIPGDACSTPQPCDPYMVCYDSNKCKCLPGLSSFPSCEIGTFFPCDLSHGSVNLVSAGPGVGYFALNFVSPTSRTDLNGCKSSCMTNCSCLALFFDDSSGNCFLFDGVGAFQSSGNSSDFTSFIKVPTISPRSSGGEKKRLPYVVAIVLATILVVVGLLVFARFKFLREKKQHQTPKEATEEDKFLETLSGTPTRFSYKDLEMATNNFSVKLGQGGFGSVYKGVLPDGTRLAVKKLESIGQGMKEFRSEVCTIGSIHHVHLVRLKGFCAEGSHRLLAYEYMGNGSLDKWIFKKNRDEMLSWETRYNIALGTAKGLAYLHEDCDSKIVHCDIKPENVLLDDNFLAKVSDFGLAKLMNREQSHVFTTLRGTRGYLAPEWITSYAISEKSDVYSYGVVLLELIGGRKNYDPSETSEKSHFPSYAFKKLEEGKFIELLDPSLQVEEGDGRVLTAIKVALWCIQEDMSLRPSMAKVVQMLEGLSQVPPPPASSPLASRLHPHLFRLPSDEATSSGTSDYNVDSYLSDVRLSGPR